jgi:uncharacterized protein (DUF2164 family)
VKLSTDEKVALLRQVQQYFDDEFDLELGDLRAEFLLDFFADLIGPAYYNEGLDDARAVAANRADTLQEELLGLRREPDSGRRGAPGRR